MEQINPYVTSQNIETMRTNYLNYIREEFENCLDHYGLVYQPESNFSYNGESVPLASNQYRIVLRTGLHLLNENADPFDSERCDYDYHFWYQTSDGRWAHKSGDLSAVLLPWGVTPSSYVGGGWMLNGDDDFYNSSICCYIITLS